MHSELTEKQQKILQFIVQFMEDSGVTPTVREIASHFGFSAPASVQRHLEALERKGYIRKHEGRARSIEPIRERVRKLFWSEHGIPLVGQVAAGTPILAEENIEAVLQVEGLFPMDDGLFALRVRGDSMIEAGIHEGDLLVIKPQPTANVGDIVVAMLGDEGTVKRFGRAGDHVRLEPANKNYLPIVTRDARVVGVAVGLVRHL